MVAKPRKPVPKKPASKLVRKKPAGEPASQKLAPLDRDKDEAKSNQIEATADDSPEDIEPSPEFRRTQAALWRRWRELGKSKEFVWETFRLKWRLGQAFEASPDLVGEFFRPTLNVTLVDSQQLTSRIDSVGDEEFRRLLWRYVNYAIRYGVVFQLFRKAPYFRVREGSQGVVDDRFHVVIRGGVFEPPTPPG